METTMQCERCGWIGSKPMRFVVNSGHSCWPIRYLCPECPKSGQHGHLKFYHIVPGEDYESFQHPDDLIEECDLPDLLDCPVGFENYLLNDERLKYIEKPSTEDPDQMERYYKKSDVDEFIRLINDQG